MLIFVDEDFWRDLLTFTASLLVDDEVRETQRQTQLQFVLGDLIMFYHGSSSLLLFPKFNSAFIPEDKPVNGG